MINVTVRQRPDRTYFQMAYTDPVTGATKTKSAGTSDIKQAEREAAKWEMELQQLNGHTAIGWALFRRRFEDEHLSTLSANSQKNYTFGMNKFESLIGKPRDIRSINANLISRYSAKLRENLPSQSSVASNLIVLRTVMNWGATVGIIAVAPKFRIPAIESRGRPITMFEFIGLLRRLKHQQHGDSLVRLAMVMWLGGLRIGEAVKLSVDSGSVQVDFSGRRPAIAWGKDGQKSKRIERSPIAVDFARYLCRFKSGLIVDSPLAMRTIKKRFTEFGDGITSHDLRRTFGTRHALRVHPLVLKSMMRHKSLETTLKYYVNIDTDEIADQLWKDVHVDVHDARIPPVSARQTKHPSLGKTGIK